MTKSILFAATFFAISFSSSAQIETKKAPAKWRISSFGLDAGLIFDNYQKMNLETMYDFTKNPLLLDRDLTGMTENLYRTSSGPRLGLNLTLTANRPESAWAHEIRLGAFFSSREPMISYDSPQIEEQFNQESIIYCNVVNELSLDGAYILRKNVGKRGWFSYYAGLGMNLGSSFNNKLVVMENTFIPTNPTESQWAFTADYYDAKSSLFTRVYVPVGIQATILRKVNLGLETNFGIGMQNVFGGKSYLMPINAGGTIRLSYNL